QAVLFMVDGVFPAWSVHLYCTDCKINYHHSFYVEGGQCVYYDVIPEIIQVGEHQFVKQRVIDMFITLMLVSWTSATNCAQFYNLTLSKGHQAPPDWVFKLELSLDIIYNGFVILSLLEDHARCNDTLKVPHTGLQKDCLQTAMKG
ncbi:hypothetical protein L208DRAFT_1324496, partial [Tricholoma matsutake]